MTVLPAESQSTIRQGHDLGMINPAIFLSVYLILYPSLQWTIGHVLMNGETRPAENLPNGLTEQQNLTINDEVSSLILENGARTHLWCLKELTPLSSMTSSQLEPKDEIALVPLDSDSQLSGAAVTEVLINIQLRTSCCVGESVNVVQAEPSYARQLMEAACQPPVIASLAGFGIALTGV